MDQGAYMTERADSWRNSAWRPYLNEVVLAGRKVHYLDIGAGPAVVLVHGLAAAWSVWFRNVRALADDHRVIAVDLPGFGESAGLGGRVAIRHYVAVLGRLLDRLEVEDVRIVGHSLGGVIARNFATWQKDRTSALVLVASGGPPRLAHELVLIGLAVGGTAMNRGAGPVLVPALRTGMSVAPLRRFLLSRIVHDPAVVSRELAAEMVSVGVRSPGTAAALRAAFREIRRHDAGSITCPTLIVGGGRDRLVPVASLEDVADAIPGARWEIMPDAGHHPMFEQPEVFNALLIEFLAEVRSLDEKYQEEK
ncbi:alpha/beta fold hydrolase [Micromonospora sp. WMMD736]|uniref:alpha/beta fold hydrolase n=1 Tax=Micromonospora sp. WMMD736 TaxID=3404112 RepID=UPI003B958FF8